MATSYIRFIHTHTHIIFNFSSDSKTQSDDNHILKELHNWAYLMQKGQLEPRHYFPGRQLKMCCVCFPLPPGMGLDASPPLPCLKSSHCLSPQLGFSSPHHDSGRLVFTFLSMPSKF